MSVRGMRRIYLEYADDPKGLLAHMKTEIIIIVMRAKALFAKDGK